MPNTPENKFWILFFSLFFWSLLASALLPSHWIIFTVMFISAGVWSYWNNNTDSRM